MLTSKSLDWAERDTTEEQSQIMDCHIKVLEKLLRVTASCN